jgi:hypothetical protein
MVIAYGATAMIAWLARRGRNPKPALNGLLGALALVAAVCIVRDLSSPYKNISDQRARGFAQWFWYNAQQNGEVACLTSDLHVILSPMHFVELNFSAQYLCNQHIYSPRHHANKPVDWDSISAAHPLVCVLFRCNSLPFDEVKYQAWQREMSQKYDLVNRDTFPVIRQDKMGRNCDMDSIEMLRYVPKTSPPQPPTTLVTQATRR